MIQEGQYMAGIWYPGFDVKIAVDWLSIRKRWIEWIFWELAGLIILSN